MQGHQNRAEVSKLRHNLGNNKGFPLEFQKLPRGKAYGGCGSQNLPDYLCPKVSKRIDRIFGSSNSSVFFNRVIEHV